MNYILISLIVINIDETISHPVESHIAISTLRVLGGKGMASSWMLKLILDSLASFCLFSASSLIWSTSLGAVTLAREMLVG